MQGFEKTLKLGVSAYCWLLREQLFSIAVSVPKVNIVVLILKFSFAEKNYFSRSYILVRWKKLFFSFLHSCSLKKSDSHSGKQKCKLMHTSAVVMNLALFFSFRRRLTMLNFFLFVGGGEWISSIISSRFLLFSRTFQIEKEKNSAREHTDKY